MAESEADILRQVAEHASSVHLLPDEQLTGPAQLEHARSQIHEAPH